MRHANRLHPCGDQLLRIGSARNPIAQLCLDPNDFAISSKVALGLGQQTLRLFVVADAERALQLTNRLPFCLKQRLSLLCPGLFDQLVEIRIFWIRLAQSLPLRERLIVLLCLFQSSRFTRQ